MKKIFTLFILLLMLPVTVLAADEPATLYVGETDITTGGYWKTTDNGKLEPGSESAYNVHYDGNGTLTLNNATIQGRGNSSNMQPEDYGIYAAPTGNQSVSLTINLIGSNTVSGIDGIRIEAKPSGNATLVIQSDRNDPTGNLKVIASAWNGIKVSADNGSVSLTINNASVEASTESQSYVGVSLASLIASAPILSLTVNGGSLTAQGKSGIRYFSGGGTNPSTSLTVSGSALIKAIPDISASVASVPTPKADSESGGIVFDGKNGTMYGDVTLQENLEIGKDETLTIPEGATLNTGDKLTNNGKIINYGTIKGTVTGTVATPLTVEMITVADATYTGVPVTPDVTVEKDGVTYTDYTVSYSNNIKAGTAIVTVTPEESSLLLGDAVTKEFTIAKATPEITLNVPLGEALVYDGKAKEVTATVKGVENETEDLTASVAYYSDDTYQTNVEEAMNAGTYYVKASFAETTNYMAMEETASFTITQAVNEWTTELSMDGWTYGEEAKKPTAVAKFGKPIFTYSNEENGTYTSELPVNAGTWYVKATVEGTDNYTGLSEIIEFTIAKAEAPEDGTIGPAEGTDKEIHIYSDQSTFSLSVVADMKSVGKWVWEVTEGTDVAEITSVEAQLKAAGNESEGNESKATFNVLGTGTAKITATYMNNNYEDYKVEFSVSVSTPPVVVTYHDLHITESTGAKLVSRYGKTSTPDGGSFTLSLEKEEGYEDCEPTVYYKRGRFGEWKELKLDEVSGYYQIRGVYTDIYVKVSGDGIWPVSNEEVEAQEVKVYARNGAIVVSTPSLMDVQVISLTGSVVAADKVAGQREFRNLAEGIYVVRVGEEIVKVRL